MSDSSVSRKISLWLGALILLIIGMIVLGGATRLTNSGLSITEWDLVSGTLPPLSEEAWIEAFEKYKQIPEYEAEHPDMDMGGFKRIFFWEWAHRLYGRIIGLVFAVPFFWFLIKGQIPKGKFPRFLLIGLLIGAQGVVGWFMVKSGLGNNRVDVSQYMLAFHLGMAFIILGLIYWTWKDHREGWALRNEPPAFPLHAGLIGILVFLQIVAGALVAGTHAGKRYNDWPYMDGNVIPDGYWDIAPFWKNFGENLAAIQFNHRILAYLLVAVAIAYWWRARKIRKIKSKAIMFQVLLAAQVGLGIYALIKVVPLEYALAHQFLAIFVFISAIGLWRGARRGY